MKKITLYLIGKGVDDLKKLRFRLETTNEKVESIIKNLTKGRLVERDNDKFVLTSKGLSLASEFFLNKEIKIRYKTNNNKPFFEYRNPLKRDIIFLPYLSFDERFNRVGEDRYRLYRTEMKFSNLDISVLQVIENLLYGTPREKNGGFWILKSKNSFCGFEVANLISAVKKLNLSKFEVILSFSGEFYILILKGQVNKKNLETLSLVIYLNNQMEMPYLDGLNYLSKDLKLFLKFVKLDRIPLGREIIIRKLPFKKFFNNCFNLSFIPDLYGKLIFKGKIWKSYPINIPFIIAINPKNMDGLTFLKRVSPWFVSCVGGFLEKDFKEKQEFRFRWVESYGFPELTIVHIMLYPYFEFEEKIFSLKDIGEIKEIEERLKQ